MNSIRRAITKCVNVIVGAVIRRQPHREPASTNYVDIVTPRFKYRVYPDGHCEGDLPSDTVLQKHLHEMLNMYATHILNYEKRKDLSQRTGLSSGLGAPVSPMIGNRFSFDGSGQDSPIKSEIH